MGVGRRIFVQKVADSLGVADCGRRGFLWDGLGFWGFQWAVGLLGAGLMWDGALLGGQGPGAGWSWGRDWYDVRGGVAGVASMLG